MGRATIGLNILGQFVQDKAKLYEELQRLKPSVVVVLDEHSMALRIREILPDTTVIFRWWHPSDHEYWQWLSPAEWLEMHGHFAVNGLVLYCLNEPSGYQDLRPLAAWCSETMRLAAQRGVRLALPHWAVGHPKEDFGAELDVLLKAFGSCPQHLLAVHEYAERSPTLEYPFRIGRYKALLARLRVLGVNVPRIIITEYGRDVGGGVNDGWRGAGLTEEQYAQFLIAGMEKTYRQDNVDVCIFGCGSGADGRWQSFNVEGANTLIGKLAEWNRSTMANYPDLTPLADAVVTATYEPDGSTVRAGASASTAKVTVLRVGQTFRISQRFFSAEGLKWYQVDVDGQRGYVADTAAFAWQVADPAPPVDGMVQVPVETLNRLLGHVHTMNQAAYDIEQLLDPLVPG